MVAANKMLYVFKDQNTKGDVLKDSGKNENFYRLF